MPNSQPRSPRIYATLLALIALTLLVGGGWLTALGGSPYYLVAGIAMAAASVLLWKGRRAGVWTFAALTFMTVVWA